ncbi:arylsulfatase B-like [Littorina saxatilis]|uniref:Sulfatase N-terminal domain-containing protein n=1 Tax=Littorina saxatilis TaxID=31220 RepID=A0AAN9GGS4_9CAEN
MSSSEIFRLVLLLVATVSYCACRRSRSRHPHIIFIVADDLGWSDVGWRDPEMHTPALDRLAKEGIILNQAYMQSSCSPSRGALMTGKYPFRLGLQHSVISAGKKEYLTDKETILPQYLRTLGYATHIVGKWHLGFCDWKYTPTYRGFDTFYGFYNAAQGYFNHTGKKNGYDFRDNEKVDWSAKGTYSTHLFATRAQRIVRDHDPDKPLFLYLPFQAVHGPFEVPQEYIDNYCSHVQDKARRVHCGMVAALDEAVGNVSQSLQDFGLADNAIVIFTTDNGGPTKKGSSNWPLRGSKTTLWEGGTRAISFVQSKSRRLLPKQGVTFNGLMHVVDWLPTLLTAAGYDSNDIPANIDGINMWKQLRRVRGRSPRREMVYNIDEVKDNAAIRIGRWKLIQGKAGKPNGWYNPPTGVRSRKVPRGKAPTLQLFDLKRDPNETRNLIKRKPKIVQRLLRKLEKYKRELVLSEPRSRMLKMSDPKLFNNTWSPGFCSEVKPTEDCL